MERPSQTDLDLNFGSPTYCAALGKLLLLSGLIFDMKKNRASTTPCVAQSK